MSNATLQPILAVLGHGLSANPSQYMLEKAFAHHQLDWRYLSLDVAPEHLADAVRGMRAMGFRGGNCAEPHKQAVLEHLDRRRIVEERSEDPLARGGVGRVELRGTAWSARNVSDHVVRRGVRCRVVRVDGLTVHIEPEGAPA